MNQNSSPHPKKRSNGKVKLKKSDQWQEKSTDHFGQSTMISKNSAQSKLRKSNPRSQNKHTDRKQKVLKRKHQRKNICKRQFTIPLLENSSSNIGESFEKLLSFREYCMIEGKWIPLLKTTQRQKLSISKRQKTLEQHKNIHLEKMQVSIEQEESSAGKVSVDMNNEVWERLQVVQPLEQIEQIFQKLEFLYLPYQYLFKEIPQCKKQHYFKLLESIMNRMQFKKHSVLKKNQLHDYDHENNFQKVIYRRECEQLGLVLSEKDEGQECIKTDLATVMFYIDTLFQIVKCQFGSEVVDNIKTAYGLKKVDKLQKLIRQENQIDICYQVLPYDIFHLLQEGSTKKTFTTPHNLAIFDSYKPFYETEGEAFPWSFHISPSITFFEITEDSLNIIFMEVKKKVIDECSMLCGLIVKQDPAITNHLHSRRMEREQNMFSKYALKRQYKNKEELQVQNFSTVLLVETSFLIQQILILEFILQLHIS